jgi:tetratricopeptide (TPR) repeat protein
MWIAALSMALAAWPRSAAAAISPEAGRYLKEGVDSIFRMEFDRADEDARLAIAAAPEHPAGYFLQAGIAWTRFVYETDQSDPRLLAPFESKVDEVIATSERWLRKNPDDPLALTAMGAAYGISSRLLVVRKEWLKAYWHARKAVAITRKAAGIDPNFYDAYLGIGMYDYYSDLYPRLVGALARLVLGGSRARGIQTLRLVADKGNFSRSIAKILLVEIYCEDPFGAKDPQQALRYVQELRAEYPGSAMMHAAELAALFYAKRYGEVASGADEYLALVREGKYNPLEAAKGYEIRGLAQWALGLKSEALESFRLSSEVKLGGRLSRWAVWSLVLSGRLHDAMGQRDEALADYRQVLKAPDDWQFQPLARDGLSKPYASSLPDGLEPP